MRGGFRPAWNEKEGDDEGQLTVQTAAMYLHGVLWRCGDKSSSCESTNRRMKQEYQVSESGQVMKYDYDYDYDFARSAFRQGTRDG